MRPRRAWRLSTGIRSTLHVRHELLAQRASILSGSGDLQVVGVVKTRRI
jgi:hypothetical protein